MPEAIQMWFEISFDVVYLLLIWGLVITMFRRRDTVRPANRQVALLVVIAFALLAFGDTGHVGFRVMAYALGNEAPQVSLLGIHCSLLGLGTLTTAITVTLFYVLMAAIWRYRFDKQYGPLEYLMFVAALIRLILLAVPANQWDSPVPPQPWSIIRNLPLLVQGLVAYSIMRDAHRQNDRAFWWVGIMILISFACYMAVVLLVQQIPPIGLLMVPKTVAYLVMALLFYNSLYSREASFV